MQGFSLVELSIVLVILGLLTGGILSGQSLIRAAELRSVSTEYGVYVTAIQTFKDKYMAIPGDFRDATKFWGKDNAACSGDTGTAAALGTCNGNGNGDWLHLNSTDTANATYENYQAWKQLALAGLIEGTYTGLGGSSGGAHVVIGGNIPSSKLGNAGWSTQALGAGITTSTAHYAIQMGNNFYYGGATPGNLSSSPVLKPEEAWNIDTKMDDGRPAYGKVVAREWNNACAAADNGTHSRTNLEASYKVSDTSIRCSLVFRNIF